MITPEVLTLMQGIQRMADVAQRHNQPEPSAMVLVREIRRLVTIIDELQQALETATATRCVRAAGSGRRRIASLWKPLRWTG